MCWTVGLIETASVGLVGALAGAFIVNLAKSYCTVAWPEFWLYFLGALFVGVTLFLPQGIIGYRRGETK